MQLKPLCVLLQIDDPLQLCDLPEHSSKSLKKIKSSSWWKGANMFMRTLILKTAKILNRWRNSHLFYFSSAVQRCSCFNHFLILSCNILLYIMGGYQHVCRCMLWGHMVTWDVTMKCIFLDKVGHAAYTALIRQWLKNKVWSEFL